MSPQSELMTYEAMSLGRRFTPVAFEVNDDLLASYAKISGQPPSKVPIGVLAIYARRAYLTEGTMPSGGVMATLELAYAAPIPLRTPLQATATVVERQERKGRGWVTLDISFTASGQAFATGRIIGVWPL